MSLLEGIEVGNLFFGTIPVHVIAIIMISQDRKHTHRRSNLIQNIFEIIHFGIDIIDQISCEENNIRLLFIHQIYQVLHGMCGEKAPGMNIRNLYYSQAFKGCGKIFEYQFLLPYLESVGTSYHSINQTKKWNGSDD